MKATPFNTRRQFKPGDVILDIPNQRPVKVIRYSRSGRNIRVSDPQLSGEYERDRQYFEEIV